MVCEEAYLARRAALRSPAPGQPPNRADAPTLGAVRRALQLVEAHSTAGAVPTAIARAAVLSLSGRDKEEPTTPPKKAGEETARHAPA